MPMPNKDFQWRPNDNSSLTTHRYDLEAEKWVKAVSKAKPSNHGSTVKGIPSDVGAIFLFLSLPLLMLGWVILIPVWLIREVIGYNIKLFYGDEPTGWIKEMERNRYRVDPKKFPKPQLNFKKPTYEEIMATVKYVREQTALAKKGNQT